MILRIFQVFSFIINFFLVYYSFGQKEEPGIENTRLEFVDGKLIIFYDLLPINKKDVFNVWIDVYKSDSALLHPVSIKGDVGYFIKRGLSKKIIWELENDNVYLNEEISVKVNALKLKYDNVKFLKVAGYSAIFPGWGLSKIDHSKPYWILGIAAGACVGTSIYFNNNAAENYDLYLKSEIITQRQDYKDKWENQYHLSKAFIYSAAAIWISDMIWASLKYLKVKNNYKNQKNDGYSIHPYYRPEYQETGMAVNLRF